MPASVPPPAHPPVLAAEDLRIDVEGVPACDGLGFRTNGEHVLVLGAPAALFRAATGLVRVRRGTLSVRGAPAADAAMRGLVAGAPADLPTPPKWTVQEYLARSARLAGLPPLPARANVASAIEKLALGPMAKVEMDRLVPAARRAVVVASALVTSAEVICLEDPLRGLPVETGEAFATMLVTALADRAWVVFAPQVPLASAFGRAATDAVVAGATRVDAQGAPAELAGSARRFVARFDGNADALDPHLAERGARLERHGAHVTVDLGPDLSTSEFIALCERAGLAVVELVPAFRALA